MVHVVIYICASYLPIFITLRSVLTFVYAFSSAYMICAIDVCSYMCVKISVPATRRHFGSEPAVSPRGRYYCSCIVGTFWSSASSHNHMIYLTDSVRFAIFVWGFASHSRLK